MELILISTVYWIGVLSAMNGMPVLSAAVLMILGLCSYYRFAVKYRDILAPPAVLSVSWLFCIGLCGLKLSGLQNSWGIYTFFVFYLVYLCFCIAFETAEKKITLPETGGNSFRSLLLYEKLNPGTTAAIIRVLTAVSLLCFLSEALILGFIPLFTEDTPHAYSTFHISGIHYFTVLSVLVPGLCVSYFSQEGQKNEKRSVMICLAISLLLPVLMVSRFQLVFSVAAAFVEFLMISRENLKRFLTVRNAVLVFAGLTLLTGVYVYITVERAHSISYLNGIFEMNDPDTPIWFSQPYIYIVNNFENFNCMIEQITRHSYGLKMLYPFFALTGLKFLFPGLLSFPLYLTRAELTTVTMFYDAYYDFGVAGIIVFSVLLGILYAYLYRIQHRKPGTLMLLVSAQLTVYLILAFFTTWFSNPTTWFYLGICIVTAAVVWYSRQRKIKKGQNNER